MREIDKRPELLGFWPFPFGRNCEVMNPAPLPQPAPFTCPHCGAAMEGIPALCLRCGVLVSGRKPSRPYWRVSRFASVLALLIWIVLCAVVLLGIFVVSLRESFHLSLEAAALIVFVGLLAGGGLIASISLFMRRGR